MSDKINNRHVKKYRQSTSHGEARGPGRSRGRLLFYSGHQEGFTIRRHEALGLRISGRELLLCCVHVKGDQCS